MDVLECVWKWEWSGVRVPHDGEGMDKMDG